MARPKTLVVPTEKVCKGCGNTLPLSSFIAASKRNLGGVGNYCALCWRERKKKIASVKLLMLDGVPFDASCARVGLVGGHLCKIGFKQSDAARKAISEKNKGKRTGKREWLSEESRRLIAEGQKNKKYSVIQHAKRAAALSGAKMTDEFLCDWVEKRIENIFLDVGRLRVGSPELREQQRVAAIKRFESSEVRKKHIAAINTPAAKHNRSVAAHAHFAKLRAKEGVPEGLTSEQRRAFRHQRKPEVVAKRRARENQRKARKNQLFSARLRGVIDAAAIDGVQAALVDMGACFCVQCEQTHPLSAFYKGSVYPKRKKPICADCERAKVRLYYKQNTKNERARVAKYKKTDRGRQSNRSYGHRRRVKVASGVTGYSAITIDQWLKLVEVSKSKCYWCGKKCKPTRDHVIPVSRGGLDTIQNVVVACMACNTSKSAKILTLC